MTTTRSRRTEFTVGRPDPPSLKDVAEPADLDRAFKALANETRRGILAALHDQGWLSQLPRHRAALRHSRGRACRATSGS